MSLTTVLLGPASPYALLITQSAGWQLFAPGGGGQNLERSEPARRGASRLITGYATRMT